MDIIAEWDWLLADFARIYRIDLGRVYRRRSWKWFVPLVQGLLADPHSMLRSQLVAAKDGGRS